MADTPEQIQTDVENFREKLQFDLELAQSIVNSAVYGWGQLTATQVNGGIVQDTTDLNILNERLTSLSDDYNSEREQSNREFKDQGEIDTVGNLPFEVKRRYTTGDFDEEIVPTEDKNIEWEAINLERFKYPLWDTSDDIVTADKIRDLKNLFLSEAAQLAITQDGWELALEKMEDDMDLAGATLGASGFRRANSWLKRAHMNIMHGMEEAYHNKNRKAAEAAIEFAKQNLYAALEMLAKLDEYLVNYNYAMAKVYKAVAQVYQEAQGIRNYIDMETYKIKKGAEITEDKIETKTDIAIMNADVRQMVLLFEANKILVMAKWEAEIKRIADRYAVEEMNKQLDDADRKLVISNAQARIQEYYNMLSQEVTYDANTLESKVKAMSVDIAAKQSMITSVGQSSLGLNTTVIQ